MGTAAAGGADAVSIQDAGDSGVDVGDAGTGTDSGESESADATVAADERDGAGEGDGAVPAPSGPGASGTVSGIGTPGPGGGSATPDTGTQPAVAGLSPTAQGALDAANRVLNKTATPTVPPKPTATTPTTPKTPAVAALTPKEQKTVDLANQMLNLPDATAAYETGAFLTGVVKNVTDFGAFVNLNGVEVLIPKKAATTAPIKALSAKVSR